MMRAMQVLFAIIAILVVQLGLSLYGFYMEAVKSSDGKFQLAKLHF